MASIQWGLQINNEGIQLVEDMSIMGMSLNMVNLERDDMSITLDYIHGKDLIKFGDKVKLYLNDALYYQGIATAPKNSFTPDSETINITVEGLWTQFSKKQDVNSDYIDDNTNTRYGNNVRDYRNFSIDRDSIKQVFTTKSLLIQVLEDAQNNGVEFDIGGVFLEDYAGYSFVKTNPNVLEMINTILSIHPEYTAYIDYSRPNPTLFVCNKKDIPGIEFPLQGPNTTSFDIVSRNDLIPKCIKIHSLASSSEIETIPNITSTVELSQDIFLVVQTFIIDENSTVECKTISLLPKEVTGANTATDNSAPTIGQSQRIKTLRYPQKFNDNIANHSTKKWWSRQIQFLYELERKKRGFNPDDLVVAEFDAELKVGYGEVTHITGHKAELIDDLAVDPDSRFKDKKASDMRAKDAADVPNQLIAGSVEDWMENSAKVGNVKVTASVGVRSTYIAAIGDKKLRQQFLDTFPIVAKIRGVSYNFNTFSRQLQATNLNTGTYYAAALPKQVEASGSSGSPDRYYSPYLLQSGYLRGSIYLYIDYLKTLRPYEGQLTITDSDIYYNNPCGRGLNIIGGETAWETMKAPITDVAYDIHNGITQMSFNIKINEFDQTSTRNDTPSPSWNDSAFGTVVDDLNYVTGSFATPEASTENLYPKKNIDGPACLSVANGFWENTTFKLFFATANMAVIHPRINGAKKYEIIANGSPLNTDGDTNYFELKPSKTYDFYLTWETDQWGEIRSEIRLLDHEPLDGVWEHYIVPSPEGISRSGRFKLHVYTAIMKPSIGEDPSLLPRCPIPTWVLYPWEGENIGGQTKLYKKYNENTYRHEIRTIGPTEELKEDSIPVQVYVEQKGDTIHISAGMEKDRVPNYGADGSLKIVSCTGSELAYLSWTNGLINTVGAQTVEVMSCSACTCESL